MQREEPDGIVIVCDFCGRDWDGQEAMIEGHHGSVLCLACTKKALAGQAAGADKYKCTLCLRFNIPPELPRWAGVPVTEAADAAGGGGVKTAVVCQECLYQAARAFSRNEDVDFKFVPAEYPPAVKVKVKAGPEAVEAPPADGAAG
jgi:hypothetical protein